jgi:hypothetical protein
MPVAGLWDFTLKSSSQDHNNQGQGCKKGAQYQNMPMYVIQWDGICYFWLQSRKLETHWDEAVAFYSGSFTL